MYAHVHVSLGRTFAKVSDAWCRPGLLLELWMPLPKESVWSLLTIYICKYYYPIYITELHFRERVHFNPLNPTGPHADQNMSVSETRVVRMRTKTCSVRKVHLPDWSACRLPRKWFCLHQTNIILPLIPQDSKVPFTQIAGKHNLHHLWVWPICLELSSLQALK